MGIEDVLVKMSSSPGVELSSDCHTPAQNEEILFASDDAIISSDEKRVVYRASEIRILFESGGIHLKEIHQAKKVFGVGTVLIAQTNETA